MIYDQETQRARTVGWRDGLAGRPARTDWIRRPSDTSAYMFSYQRGVARAKKAAPSKAAAGPVKKFYEGRITPDGCVVMVTSEKRNTRPRRLCPRLDLRNHSPTGLAWGYGGSGPAQLALAILADLLEDDERAQALYQPFKWKVIARLPQNADWILTGEGILAALDEIEAERAFRRWLDDEAPTVLGTSGRSAVLIEADPEHRRVLLDAEGLFAPQWVAVPDGVPVPSLPREGRP